jgi:potassium-transporting ATPase KdpC subunit
MNTFLIALRLFAVLTLLTGVVYPLLVTGIAQTFFADKANGSLVYKAGDRQTLVGSELLAQQSDSAMYFQSRPSACNYGTVASGASNKGPTNADLVKLVGERRTAFRAANALDPRAALPNEMVFASGSGLDPHISPEAARMQVRRVSAERNFNSAQKQALERLVEQSVESPQFGIFGNARVNVVKLNIALDAL